MKVKVTKETKVRLTLTMAEANALFWSMRPGSIPEHKGTPMRVIAKAIENELAIVLDENGGTDD